MPPEVEETQAQPPVAEEVQDQQPPQEVDHEEDVQEVPGVEADAPEQPVAPEVTEEVLVDEEDDEPVIDFTPSAVPEVAPFDISKLPQDEDGNVDPAAFQTALGEYIAAEASRQAQTGTNQLRMEMQYEREWNKAVSKFPELKTDKELRQLVQDQWMAGVLLNDGTGYKSPEKVASRFQKLRGSAKQEGIKSATETVRVQASAHLESSATTAAPKASGAASAKERINNATSRAELDAANLDYLKELIRSGDIETS